MLLLVFSKVSYSYLRAITTCLGQFKKLNLCYGLLACIFYFRLQIKVFELLSANDKWKKSTYRKKWNVIKSFRAVSTVTVLRVVRAWLLKCIVFAPAKLFTQKQRCTAFRRWQGHTSQSIAGVALCILETLPNSSSPLLSETWAYSKWSVRRQLFTILRYNISDNRQACTYCFSRYKYLSYLLNFVLIISR